MDWLKLAEKLRQMTPDWDYHMVAEGGGHAHIHAYKGEMGFLLTRTKDGDQVLAYPMFPEHLLKDDANIASITGYRRSVHSYSVFYMDKNGDWKPWPEEILAGTIVGRFLAPYQRFFAELSGRITAAKEQRYTLANRLMEVGGNSAQMLVSGDYPEVSAHGLSWAVEASVRSGDLVYLDLIVPADTAKEVLKLVTALAGKEQDGHNTIDP